MTIFDHAPVLVVTLTLMLSACGGNSGEEAREAAADVVARTQEVAKEVAVKAREIAGDAADKTQEVAGEVTDSTREAADKATAAINENTSGGWAGIKANWSDWSERVQNRFDKLSVEDVIGTRGEREELVRLIQQKYEVTKANAAKRLDEWQSETSGEPATGQ